MKNIRLSKKEHDAILIAGVKVRIDDLNHELDRLQRLLAKLGQFPLPATSPLHADPPKKFTRKPMTAAQKKNLSKVMKKVWKDKQTGAIQ